MSCFLLIGGNLNNRGAQAMTFYTVSALREHFGEGCRIFFATPYPEELARQEDYRMDFLYDSIGSRLYAGHPLGRLVVGVARPALKPSARELTEAYAQADAVIDISGYALGSNWGVKKTLHYLLGISAAKRAGKPVFLLPQSFGPFDYPGPIRAFVMAAIRRTLRYPAAIFARERQGEALLRQLKLENLQYCPDLVLAGPEPSGAMIYSRRGGDLLPAVGGRGNVAIVPNRKVFEQLGRVESLALYTKLLARLRRLNKRVYLLYHANEDRELCQAIQAAAGWTVFWDRQESCLQFERLAAYFDYMIASRYHAIVHAYRQGVPCVIPGWAEKYRELAGWMGQQDYVFDIESIKNPEELLRAVERMDENWREESAGISEALRRLRSGNDDCFRRLFRQMESMRGDVREGVR